MSMDAFSFDLLRMCFDATLMREMFLFVVTPIGNKTKKLEQYLKFSIHFFQTFRIGKTNKHDHANC